MYREILKTAGFQVKPVWLQSSIIVICLSGWLSAANAESTAVSVTGDTVAALSSVVPKSVGPDTKPKAAEKKASGATASLSVAHGRVGSLQPGAQKQAVSPPSPQRQKFIGVASAIIRALGEKVSGPFKRIAGVKVHLKKSCFLIGSIVLVLITLRFYQNYRERGRFMTTTRLSIMDKEIQRACRYIEAHYDDPALDLQGICSALVTGGAFLEALFIKELGLTVDDFITQVRINRAKIALRKNPGLPVDVLARSVGFGDSEVFMKRFADITGIDCQSYRKALAHDNDAAA
ncbi:MAG: helix-turn-helix transcriptional regulator [Chitinispirillaceae bacterium]|nr:helix-turn-helix transcriptional regulator [Chitinispirillaceae bacterium]